MLYHLFSRGKGLRDVWLDCVLFKYYGGYTEEICYRIIPYMSTLPVLDAAESKGFLRKPLGDFRYNSSPIRNASNVVTYY